MRAKQLLGSRGIEPLLGGLPAIERWVRSTPAARGMRVRARGTSVILGRALRGSRKADDRLKLTPLGPRLYSLQAADWKGRWADTGMRGDLSALLGFVLDALPHHLATHADNVTAPPPPRTLDRRH